MHYGGGGLSGARNRPISGTDHAGMTLKCATAVAALALSAPAAMAAAGPPAKVGRAVLSFYWIIDENAAQYRSGSGAVLRDARGRVIASTSRKFRKALVLEGTGWLRDGRVVMYDCRVGGEHRFRVTKAKNGRAVTGCELVPYRTVAVDPRVIKLGSMLYIPQLKGARLPDGTLHDGVFLAADRGHFRGHHVDLFVGVSARGARPFVQRGYGSRSHVTVYLLSQRADAQIGPRTRRSHTASARNAAANANPIHKPGLIRKSIGWKWPNIGSPFIGSMPPVMREPRRWPRCDVLKAIFSRMPTAISGMNAQRNGMRRAHAETSSSQAKIGA